MRKTDMTAVIVLISAVAIFLTVLTVALVAEAIDENQYRYPSCAPQEAFLVYNNTDDGDGRKEFICVPYTWVEAAKDLPQE